MGRYDEAWEKILAGTSAASILASTGHLQISADVLRDLGGKEPRLLAKWDTLSDRPRGVSQLGASLLPIRNGLYLLFRDPGDKAYFRFEGKTPPARAFDSAMDLASFDTYPGDALSESQALDFAYLAGIFADFAGDDSLRLTLRGRLFSRKFSFEMPHLGLCSVVDQVQIEIDAGFEGRDCLMLVEAKRGNRDHAMIRQMWYPYLAWRTRTRKKVLPVFFTYANGQVLLTELRFTEVFGEVEQVRMRAYALNPSPPPKVSLRKLLSYGEAHNEYPPMGVPLPQANDLEKLIDLLLLLVQAPMERDAIALVFGMDPRQADYYSNAAIYLNLIQKCDDGCQLTATGLSLATLPLRSQRCEALIRRMVSDKTIRNVFYTWIQSGLRTEAMDVNQLAQTLTASHALSDSTAKRRAECLIRWVEWVASNARVTA